MHPKVCIIILNYDGLLDTIECLRSIQKITYPNYKVLVVDNGSKGNDAEVIRKEFRDLVRVIKIEKNIGFTGGANVGIRFAHSFGVSYVLLLNNDVIVDPNFLTEMVNVSENDSKIGIVGPKIYYQEKHNLIYSAGGRVNFFTGITPNIGAREIDEGQFDTIKEVDYVGMLLIRVKTIQKIGLLDDIYFTYYSDTDLCSKALRAGYKVVYAPKAKIWHKGHDDKTSSEKETVLYYMTRNRILFEKKNANTLQFIVFNLYFFTTDVIFNIRNFFKNPLLFAAYIRGVFDGLRLLGHNILS